MSAPIKTHIVIHHSLTKDSDTVSWNAIRKYHMGELKWKNIGYHMGIEMVNGFPEILVGRFETETGAHCTQANMNKVGIGICCVGNYDLIVPPKAIWDRCLALCRDIMLRNSILKSNVVGHRELYPAKSCPGTLWDMIKFRNEL